MVTDSAVRAAGAEVSNTGVKLWHLPSASVWIAGAGSFRLSPPPALWPSPFGDRQPRSFDQALLAIQDQIKSVIEGPEFALAIAGGDSAHVPKLAKLSNRGGIEHGHPGTVYLGGFATAVVPWSSAAPTSLARSRDLVVAHAARTIAACSRDAAGTTVVTYPLRLYQWEWRRHSDGGMRTHFTQSTIEESGAPAALRRAFAAAQTMAAMPKVARGMEASILTQLVERDLATDAVAVNVDLRVSVNPVHCD